MPSRFPDELTRLAELNTLPYTGDGTRVQAARQRIIDAYQLGLADCRATHGACGQPARWSVGPAGWTDTPAQDVCTEHLAAAVQKAHDNCSSSLEVDCPHGSTCQWAGP